MKVVILQSNYLPWKGYFDLIHDADCFVFYDEVQYTKNDWRNRNRLSCLGGQHWLTIPVSKQAVRLKISEVSLIDASWQHKHAQSLRSCYGRAPFYQELEPIFEATYVARQWTRLSELNQYLIRQFSQRLGLQTRFVDSVDFPLEGERVERLINILVALQADEYISGPSARDYLQSQEGLFEQRGIKLTYKDYSGYPVYPQYGVDFEHAVSIVDLVAHVGFAAAPDYIWGRYRE